MRFRIKDFRPINRISRILPLVSVALLMAVGAALPNAGAADDGRPLTILVMLKKKTHPFVKYLDEHYHVTLHFAVPETGKGIPGVAAVWQAFVAGTKEVTLTEPAGLGDGQKFAAHPAGKPVGVKLKLAANLKPAKVELWDAHEKLAEKAEAPWSFEIVLKPGVHALFATVQQAGQPPRTSRPHTTVVTEP